MYKVKRFSKNKEKESDSIGRYSKGLIGAGIGVSAGAEIGSATQAIRSLNSIAKSKGIDPATLSPEAYQEYHNYVSKMGKDDFKVSKEMVDKLGDKNLIKANKQAKMANTLGKVSKAGVVAAGIGATAYLGNKVVKSIKKNKD